MASVSANAKVSSRLILKEAFLHIPWLSSLMARDIEDIKHNTVKNAVLTMSTKDLTYRIAKALLLHYVHGEYEYSACLREVCAKGGEYSIIQRIAKEMQIIRAAKSLASYSSSSSDEASGGEIINFRPANQKPSFKFEPSSIGATLPSFLATLKASNEELATGVPADSKFELSGSDSEGQHIEMNLGLGVLEQTAPADALTPTLLARKRKSDSVSDSADSAASSPKKIKLKLITTRKIADAAASSSASFPASTSPPIKIKPRSPSKVAVEDGSNSSSSGNPPPIDAMPAPRIKIILYHNSYAHAKYKSPKSAAKPATIKKKASKKQKMEAKEQEAPKKPKIILKLTIKKGAEAKTLRVPNAVLAPVYPPQSGTEAFPAFYHHTEAEMEAWNESVLAALGEGSLPGFDVVDDNE